MEEKVLFFDTILMRNAFGGNKLARIYGNQSDEFIGEAWLLSGLIGNESMILNGKYKGQGINECYFKNPDVFNTKKHHVFPFIIKYMDIKKDLGLFISPDDAYVKRYYNQLGCIKFCYVLEANDNTKIIYGLNTKDKQEFEDGLNLNVQDKYYNFLDIRIDDHFYLKPGLLYSLPKDVELIQVQKNFGVTFSVTNYDEKKIVKNKEINLKSAAKLINYKMRKSIVHNPIFGLVERLIESKAFTIDKISANGSIKIDNNNKYLIGYVKDNHINLSVDDVKFLIRPYQLFLITAYANDIIIDASGDVLIIQEENYPLELMYSKVI